MPELALSGSLIEAKAAEASNKAALGSVNLYAIRENLRQLLEAVGRTAQFATYTKHDITHIDSMLRAADWIIPQATMARLTTADALVITLVIYVHDLGMIVTEKEYSNRTASDFPTFASSILNDASDRGVDFRDRLAALPEDKREQFLYEEFVRTYHAERIEAWVNGVPHQKYGVADDAAQIVSEVFSPLELVLRKDIAMVARSHHMSDLDDISKYKLNRSYGVDPDDVANLQYAAVILRTADLLHMTRDRTPMIQFRLASPSDPMGQREWQKQNSVRAVKPKIPDDGEANTVEIHATFERAEGFFALMEYLDYCETEIIQSQAWITNSIQAHAAGSGYEFPWGKIDREQIEADGFDRSQFTFSFDQQKVLELLTGHTLYNDAGVAIRELVQNSIDAVRLARARGLHDNGAEPEIEVTYDSESRTLRVLDHGVGMAQSDIETHFLKVGSSSYQTSEFKEEFPNFTSISRFGIGVLSAFMIADEVRVATIPPIHDTGRELVLKSVHGRYLIKQFDRASEYGSRIGAHGTEIELKLRASSGLADDVMTLMKRWILLPGCHVTCVQDGKNAVRIGSATPKDALERMIEALPLKNVKTRVKEYAFGTTKIAVAQTWNPHFREWDALRYDRRQALDALGGPQAYEPISGVSIQGVRVTHHVPGFSESGPLMLANVDGVTAPTTNVARTQLESGPQLEALTTDVYRALIGSITSQIDEISKRVSKRLALSEASHMFDDATRGDSGILYVRPGLLRSVLRSSDLHPVEVAGNLESLSSIDLENSGFTVLVGPAADDAARFLDWLPKPKGLLALLQEGGLLSEAGDGSLPLLGGRGALFAYDELLWDTFEVSSVRALESGTSLHLTFAKRSGRWRTSGPNMRDLLPHIRSLREAVDTARNDRHYYSRSRGLLYGADGVVDVSGLDDYDAFVVDDYTLFLPTSPFARVQAELYKAHDDQPTDATSAALAALHVIADWSTGFRQGSESDRRFAEVVAGWLQSPDRASWPELRGLKELLDAGLSMKIWTSAAAWQRRGDEARR